MLAPVATDHDAAWHREAFADFTDLKRQIGEPSPHLNAINWIASEGTLTDRLWAIGCYAVPYSLPTAVALLTAFPDATEPSLEWLRDNWAGMHTRTERRAVRTPEKFHRSIASYRLWVLRGEAERLLSYPASYETWWDSVNSVEFFGRYISIRVIEAIRRSEALLGRDHPTMHLKDIRSIGGHSPIRALTLFFPESEKALLSQDTMTADVLGEGLFREIRERLPWLDHYVYAAMLCEYREAYEDRHQYPGRTIDQELEYLGGEKSAYWAERGVDFGRIWAARKVLHPAASLGEIQGWPGVRHELSAHLRDTGRNWSDLRERYVQ